MTQAHAIGIALIVALWSGLTLGVFWDHGTRGEHARAETANLANILSEHVNRTLREADQLARMFEWEAQENGMALPLLEYVRRGAVKLDVFFQISVIDNKGNLSASTAPGFQPVNLLDREYFKVHAAGDTGKLFISKPVIDRSSGRPSIQLSRRINRPDGSFGGVVAISLDAAYFSNLYKELHIGKTGQIAIVGTYDRVFRARRDGDNSVDARETLPIDSSIFQAMQASASGVVLTRGIRDGQPRLYGYDKLDDYPLTVTVGFSEKEVMAPYTARRNFLITLGAIITLLIAGAAARRATLLRRLYRTVDAEQAAMHAERQKNDYLNSMFKAIPDGVLIFTDEGNIERGNQVVAQMLGLGAEALELLPTLRFAELFFRDDRTPDRQRKINQLGHTLLNAQNDEPEYFTVVIERPAISVFEFHIRYSRSGFSGGVAVIRDVTKQSQADRMKSDFISTAAHELRTPMAGILGFTELLKAGRITDAQHEDVFTLLHERAKKMSDVLSELLDLARLEARADKDFDYARINVYSLCHNVVEAEPVFATRVQIAVDCDNTWLYGDRLKLMLALRNLLENAIKYSTGGSDVLLLVRGNGDGSRVVIEIQDEGIGMSEQDCSRAFEKFYRADKSGAIPGTGLGLALVREIITLHGGTVALRSELRRGTTATIELDAHPAGSITVIPDIFPL